MVAAASIQHDLLLLEGKRVLIDCLLLHMLLRLLRLPWPLIPTPSDTRRALLSHPSGHIFLILLFFDPLVRRMLLHRRHGASIFSRVDIGLMVAGPSHKHFRVSLVDT